jgi:hypothetical protein
MRRAIRAGAALTILPKSPDAAFTAPVVVADATYWTPEEGWRLTVYADYSARLNVEFKRFTIGTVSGQFSIYDTGAVESHHLAAFSRLKAVVVPPRPPTHPLAYEISLRMPNSEGLHRVKVYADSTMPDSVELRAFAARWKRLWSEIRGAPTYP